MTDLLLGPWSAGVAGLLLAANALLSWGLGLGLERQLLVAVIRMVLQLSAFGLILKLVLDSASPALTGFVAMAMIAVASAEVLRRTRRRVAGRWQQWTLGTAALLSGSLVGTLYAASLVAVAEPWWAPRTLLPVLGLVLGNAMTTVTLLLDTLTATVSRERAAIEARLAAGASRIEALKGPLAGALQAVMVPMLNTMAIAGLAAMPGLMSGQIIAGAAPMHAAGYQIAILCLITGTGALSAVLAGIGGLWLLTDRRHRLRLEKLQPDR